MDGLSPKDRPVDCLLPQPQILIHYQFLAIACPSHCRGVDLVKERVEGLALKNVIVNLFCGMRGPLVEEAIDELRGQLLLLGRRERRQVLGRRVKQEFSL